jgi:outer membrane receptor protein involved in Fe transport
MKLVPLTISHERFLNMETTMRRLLSSSLSTVSVVALTLGAFAAPASAAVQSTSQPRQTQPEDDDNVVTDATPQSDADATLPAAGDTNEGEVVVVTGSRIRTRQYDFANPVVSIDSSSIQNAGVTNLTDFLTQSPALTGSTTSNDTSGTNAGIGAVGLNLLNLRNLGTQRTLVLVDGRRHVAAVPGSSSVDINTIPVDLIDRLDIVTGAASAIYGADAVTGVVNFVMKRNFEGLNIRAQAGISEYGDAATQFVSATAGMNFAGGRGNIALAAEYGHEDVFNRRQRAFLRQDACFFYRNPADVPDDPNIPDQALACDVRYNDSHPLSAIDTSLDFLPEFIGTGEPFIRGRPIPGNTFEIGGSGTGVNTYSGDLVPKTDRYVANLLLNYELTDAIRFYANGKYARVESQTVNQPTFDFSLRVRPDNPFLPATILADMNRRGRTFALANRDNFELGRRGQDGIRQTYRGVVGFVADLTENIALDVSYVYGRSDNRVTQTDNRYNDRFFAAIDAVRDPATGNIVCRSNIRPVTESNQPFYNFQSAPFDFANPTNGRNPVQLSFTPGPNSGCIPFNLFSDQQLPGAIDWLLVDSRDRSRIQQHVASAVLSGDLGDTIRLWGDEIGFAVGAEYRKEKSSNLPDPVAVTFYTFGNRLFPTRGSFDVKEAFAEVRIPIISERFIHDLTVNGAVRYSEYSTIGNTFTYQGGIAFAPVPDIRFRGTYAQAVRAPNIAELFGPASQTFQFFSTTDPCQPQNLNNGTANRRANCIALFQRLGLTAEQIANFTGAQSANVPGLSSGNPSLSEETAKTLTGGVVLRPRFIPGLALSADYYDVKIKNAVSTPGATTVAALCVDEPTIDNVFCAAIDRRPGSAGVNAGLVSGFRVLPQNVARFRTSGIDFAANYRLDTGENTGTINFRFEGNYLQRLEFIPLPGGNLVRSSGILGAPKYQVNFDATWQLDQFRLNYGINYFSKTLRTTRAMALAQPDFYAPEFMKIDERFTHDLQASVTVNERMSFYGGVNNIFGQLPDVGLTFDPVPATGRFIYVGARVNFPGL